VEIKLDSGREVRFNLEENRHLDHGYAVTSHSSQGATADRVLIHIDSEAAHEKLINSRLAYVAVSRARYDAQIFTNDAGNLGKLLSREISHAAAVDDWKHDAGTSNGTGVASANHREETGHSQGHAESHGYAMSLE
jgi:ATP-dependent exoDNAse (exonuclease V) alpha subunit